MSKETFKLLLLDVNGVQVFARPHILYSNVKAFADFGYTLTEPEFIQVYEVDERHSAGVIHDHKLSIDPTEFRDRRWHHLKQSVRDRPVEIIHGLSGFLGLVRTYLSPDIQIGSVSNHDQREVRLFHRSAKLGDDNLAGKFDIDVTRDMVLRGKRYPDPWVKALDMAGIADPKYCLVVENSPVAINSAREAGVEHVIGIRSGLREHSPKGVVVVNDLTMITPEVFESLEAKLQ